MLLSMFSMFSHKWPQFLVRAELNQTQVRQLKRETLAKHNLTENSCSTLEARPHLMRELVNE